MVGFLQCLSQLGTAFPLFSLLVSPNFRVNCENPSSLSCYGCASWRGQCCLVLIATSVLEEQNRFVWSVWWVFANISYADWCGEVGFAYVAPHFWGGDHLQAGAVPVKWDVASCCLCQPWGHQHQFYNHLLVIYKLTACLAFSAACGNNFSPSFKTSLMGTPYAVFAYSSSGFAVKVGWERLTLWWGESRMVFRPQWDDG